MNDEIQDLNMQVDRIANSIYIYATTIEFPNIRDLEDEDTKRDGIKDLKEIRDRLFEAFELLVDYRNNYGETE